MRKIFICLPVVLFMLAVSWSSCKKDSLEALQKCETCPTSICDTAFVLSYANDIAPIIAKDCSECHAQSTSFNGGGNILDNYNSLIGYVNDGRIMGVITHADGYPPMPDQKPQISDCKIGRIENWIRQGAPNN
jgi:hypothetical protein